MNLSESIFASLDDVGIVIYDLDGTLYEETRHFVYYAELLRDALPPHRRDDFWNELETIWSGRHPLRIGRVYDAEQDRILSVDERMRVTQAWAWSGESLEEAALEEDYPEPIVCRMEGPKIAVGDGWWIPVVCARRYGLTDTREQYLQTKQQLHETPEWLRPIPGVADAIRKARHAVPQVVATNSHLEDAQELLQRLGLADVVSGLYPSCNKPTDAARWFQRICDDYDVPLERALSVGDNYLNEIVPALELGMKGVLIDGENAFDNVSAVSADAEARLLRVRSITELIPWLNFIGEGASRHDGIGEGA